MGRRPRVWLSLLLSAASHGTLSLFCVMPLVPQSLAANLANNCAAALLKIERPAAALKEVGTPSSPELCKPLLHASPLAPLQALATLSGSAHFSALKLLRFALATVSRILLPPLSQLAEAVRVSEGIKFDLSKVHYRQAQAHEMIAKKGAWKEGSGPFGHL